MFITLCSHAERVVVGIHMCVLEKFLNLASEESDSPQMVMVTFS